MAATVGVCRYYYRAYMDADRDGGVSMVVRFETAFNIGELI